MTVLIVFGIEIFVVYTVSFLLCFEKIFCYSNLRGWWNLEGLFDYFCDSATDLALNKIEVISSVRKP